ncbi:MAG: signal transduction histidine kinase/ActR/RegA family two-component response regulator [Candidatus Azotimanducaceae bacterium]|jgi:signal transduction histidine kinase/ActR/RegA family two-component response regulator
MTDKITREPDADNDEILFDINGDSNCIYMSPAAKRWLGISDLMTTEVLFADFPELLQGFTQMVQDGEVVELATAYGYRWELQPMYDQANDFAGAIITAHVLPNTQALIADGAPLPTTPWQYDLVQDVLVLRPELKLVLGLGNAPLSLAGLAHRPALVDVLTHQIERLRTGQAELFAAEVSVGDPAGELYNFLIRGQVCDRDADRNVTRVIGVIEDIGRHIEQLQRQRQDESTMIRVQKMEAIGNLVGGIAHDFNNILSSIIGYTELALMESAEQTLDKPRLSTYLQEVFQGGKRARELVAKMQSFSRADETQPQNIDLMLEIKEAVKMLRASLPSSIEIRLDIDESLPEVFIDNAFLQQMIMNSCINSRDAMADVGTIFIRARTTEIKKQRCSSCYEYFDGEYVELAIEDTGSGIDPALIEGVFEPYVTSKPMGSGMGLATLHGMMHRERGHVRLDSIQGDGTELRLFFPPASAYSHTFPEQPNLDVQQTRGNEEKHILVIDDEVSLVYYLRELLRRKGYEVTVASDSHEAWDIFSADPDKYDLVITDQTMPGLSGVQLAAKMLTLRENLPIVLCTGYSDIVEESNISQYGIKGYMAKPIDSRELLRTVHDLLLQAAHLFRL